MRRYLRTITPFAAVFVLALALVGIPSFSASALSGSEFQAGNIIDDYTFNNKESMNVSEIQAFLSAKVPTCDTNGTGTTYDSDYGDTVTRAVYSSRRGVSTPFTCLKDYRMDTSNIASSSTCNGYTGAANETAATIIYKVAQSCDVSPKVLLVTLQKEQSLVTDTWPWPKQYQKAMGAFCPDTAPCDSGYAGFFKQVYFGANRFKVYAANPTSYNYRSGRNNTVYFHPGPCQTVTNGVCTKYFGNKYDGNGNSIPDITYCGSTNIYIQNQATANLYIYTPYQPNPAALNNLYGTGDTCSSYGNRNFWRMFSDWFGSTHGFPILSEVSNRYNALGGMNGSLGAPVDGGHCNDTRTTCWQGFRNGFIMYGSSTGAWESKGSIRERWAELSYQTGVLGFPNGPETFDKNSNGWWQGYQNGAIIGTGSTGYWESLNGPIRSRWAQLKYQNGSLGYPKGPVASGSNGSKWQEYQKGFLIQAPGASQAWESKGAIREYWAKIGYQNGALGYPIGAEVSNGATWWQKYNNGYIIGTAATGYWESLNGPLRTRWGQLNYQTGSLGHPVGPITNSASGAKWQPYQKGFLIQAPGASQAWESKGAIREYWAKIGYQNGALGYPIGAEVSNGATWWQKYNNGYIIGTAATGYWESLNGPLRTRWGQLNYQTGSLGHPVGPITNSASGAKWQPYQKGFLIQAPGASQAWESKGAIREYWAKIGYQNGVAGFPTGPEQFNASTQTWSQAYQNGTIYHTNSGIDSFVAN